MFNQNPFQFVPNPLPDDIVINVSRQLGTSIQWLLVYRGNDPVLARTALALAMGRDGVTALQVGVIYGAWDTPEYTDIRSDITPDGTVTFKLHNNERSNRERKPIYQTLMVPAVTLAKVA